MRTLQTFVVRILAHDDFGSELHGQISEPASADEWRASFTGVQELFEQMLSRLAAAGDLESIGTDPHRPSSKQSAHKE